jgi:phytoene dehydrogenase-like protein
MTSAPGTIIVGAGLAGLAAAARLHAAGHPALVLEAGDAPGGRVRTDPIDGFRLDRGFQVLLTAYPEARALLDLDALDLRAFEPGALVRADCRWHRLGDPWRRPRALPGTLAAGVGTLADKLRIARLRTALLREPADARYQRPETTTARRLADLGFGPGIVERFFRPFLGGIFLDPALVTSSRMFDFVFRMFGEGDAALPAGGMQAIPDQLAARLPAGAVRCGTRVAGVERGAVRLASGERLPARAVIVAAGPDLPGLTPPPQAARGWQSVACLYFAADRAPEPAGRHLVLNGEGAGPVNNLCVPSNLAPDLAPPGAALVSATVLGDPPETDAALARAVRDQLAGWYGAGPVEGWRLLSVCRVRRALPLQAPPWYTRPDWPVRVRPGLYVAGDVLDTAAIDGALRSGRLAAEALLADAP